MGQRTREKEDVDMNIKSSNVPLHYCSDHIMWQKTKNKRKRKSRYKYWIFS